jgi:hypothetical protein
MTEPHKPPDGATVWAKHEGLYSSVGQAISFWASMEGKVVQIGARLLGTSDIKAGLMFYSIMNFFSWLTIVDELFSLEPKFNSLKDDWGDISNKLRGFNDTRVRLAHHTIWDYPESDGLGLRPGKLDVRAKSRKHLPLGDLDIAKFAQSILDVENELWRILAVMETIDKEPPSSLRGTLFEPTADPQPPADAQLHSSGKAPQHPPQS